jgi:hypothetical protein
MRFRWSLSGRLHGLVTPQNIRQNNNLMRLCRFSSEQPAGESSDSNMTWLGGKQDPKTRTGSHVGRTLCLSWPGMARRRRA